VTSRYARQSLLPWIGEAGQRRIGRSTAAVVGLGATGCVTAAFLARAGVGKLVLVDRDFVEENNLHRQLLYEEEDCARRLPKAVAAAARLRGVRPDLEIEPLDADFGPELAREIVPMCDLLLDGTDNFETRYLMNDAAVACGKPWVYAGAVSAHGSVLVVRPGETACLRCLFPDPPPPGSAPTCDTAGVLGPAAGAVASVQAGEALKLLAGRPDL
jgi:adenylyltransferase/sulfurtransferase